ncbi:AMP-dependent synthetase/ligase [Actinocorallia sp. API 0066]|uniref:AMP-dependent synthetase/ligase n=1 Tax=Actinocorallia sp. API 0066 TaxID=2896846 RepID=UPI001E295DBB|nr:AMP-dependent synthetase/ligase [Actinocorallia sp. API 0066]MCD0450979.1 AMP-dependent synthetase/ligase [Actinocorallia sp. API 0066]
MREYTAPALVEVPSSTTTTDTVFERAARDPRQTAFRRRLPGGWRPVTIGEFRDEVVSIAKGLIAKGVKPGDRVGLLSRNRYEWTVIDYAIWTAGAVTVPVYETSSVEQITWILSDSGAVGIFTETVTHKASAKEAGADQVWVIEDDGLAELAEAGASVTDEQVEAARTSRTSTDLATLIYTSGTTGRPKGCELTHANFVELCRNAKEGELKEVLTGRADASTLLFIPLAHVFARLIQVLVIESGVVLGHSPDIKNLLEDLGSFKPTFLLAVPRVFEKVYNGAEQKAITGGKGNIFAKAADTAIAYSKAQDTPSGPGLGLKVKHAVFDKLVYGKLREAVGGNVSHAVSGGAALGERLGHFFRGVGITILEGYGLTETTAPATVNTPRNLRIGTVGKPVPGTSIRIAEDGEILIKGVGVLGGYWNNETASKEALEDGWFRTGDLGSLDADGFLSITGRKKEILVTAGGKNVAPAPLEDRVRAHPLVSQCLVVGEGQRFIAALVTLDPEAIGPWQETNGLAGKSVVELAEDPKVLAEIGKAVANANLSVSNAEQIKKFQILEEDFTVENDYLTPSLKVKRHLVVRDFTGVIEDIYR